MSDCILSRVSRLALAALSLFLLSACADSPAGKGFGLPDLITKPAAEAAAGSVDLNPDPARTIASGPAVPAATGESQAQGDLDLPYLDGNATTLTFEAAPLPAFVTAVYGQMLGLDVQMDPEVAARTDLVTLRTGKPREPGELFAIAREVLASYGVSVGYEDGIVQVLSDASLAARQPQVVRGRAAAEVPSQMRPVFQFLPVHHVSAVSMQEWLNSAFGESLHVVAAPQSSAVLLLGLPADVAHAVDAAATLDQPRLAGRESLRVEPVYWSSAALARKLAEILTAEGYDTSMSVDRPAAVTVLPIEQRNALVIFAGDPGTLGHAAQWVRDLDQPAKADPLRSTFVYFVRNTTAQSLGEVLMSVVGGPAATGGGVSAGGLDDDPQASGFGAPSAAPLGGSGAFARPQPGTAPSLVPPMPSPIQGPAGADTSQGGPGPDRPAVLSGGTADSRIVVDTARNALIFVGSAEAYGRIRGLMEALDQSPREVLIEVTIAEVTLNDETQLGVEWALALGLGSPNRPAVGNLGGLGQGTARVTYAILDSKIQARAILEAFARNDQVSILSTPRLLARSGSRAQITVGTEVPIITSQGTRADLQEGGNSAILQQIQYRNTGVILRVRPVVHSRDHVDIDLSQEVSEAQINQVSAVSSPLIFNRSLSTQLSLRDGATVLLGGLMSETRGNNETGVPLLRSIPGLGMLFRNEAIRHRKTELLVFLTPYIINSQADVEGITSTFERRMADWPQIDTKLRFP